MTDRSAVPAIATTNQGDLRSRPRLTKTERSGTLKSIRTIPADEKRNLSLFQNLQLRRHAGRCTAWKGLNRHMALREWLRSALSTMIEDYPTKQHFRTRKAPLSFV